MERSHLDEGEDFAGVTANVHLCLPTKLEQNKPLTVTSAEDLSKASLTIMGRACIEFSCTSRKAERKVSSSRDANMY